MRVHSAPETVMTSRVFSIRGVVLLAVLFLITLPAVTTRVNASDEIQFYSWLPSWTFDRDIDFTNEYRYFHDLGPGRTQGFVDTFLEATNEAGRRPNFAPIGSALLWLPFYAAGHVAAIAGAGPVNGFSAPYVTAVAWGSAFYGLLALMLSVAITRRVIGRNAWLPAVVVWLGTPLVFYMYVAPVFAHACSAFAVALFLWTWLRVRERWSVAGAIALGLAGALLPMVREQDLFFVAGPALDFCLWASRNVRARTRAASTPLVPATSILVRAAAGIASFALAYTPQLLAYQALNGHPGPTEKVARKMTWTSPHFFEVLFSPQHGLFLWTPLALIAVAGLVRLCARPAEVRAAQTGAPLHDVRWVAGLFVLMVGLQAYISGSVESWTVAGAFGQRRFVALTPLLVVGLAAWVPPPRAFATAWRPILVATAALAIWWNVGLMAQFGLHLMDRQRLSLPDNARVTFIELPRMAPSIVMRYLTNRESFYGRPRE